MKTHKLKSLVAVAVLVACAPESSEPIVGLQAHSFTDSEWSEPVLVNVNSPFAEQTPTLSPDELSLYFQSDRPDGLGGIDIWVARRDCPDCPWGAPQNLGSLFNGAGADFAPNLSNDGHLLFFASNRAGGHGANDIWVSRRNDTNDDFAWGAPANLGSDVNLATNDQAPMYLQSAEDGSANLYFNRGVNALLQADLYYAPVTRDGETLGPAVFVAELNIAGANEARPTVRADGREILFWSSRTGGLGATDLWRSTRRSVHDPWSPPENVGAPINTSVGEVTPSLSHDGRTLVFASNRPGSTPSPSGAPSFDIWISTRTPSGN